MTASWTRPRCGADTFAVEFDRPAAAVHPGDADADGVESGRGCRLDRGDPFMPVEAVAVVALAVACCQAARCQGGEAGFCSCHSLLIPAGDLRGMQPVDRTSEQCSQREGGDRERNEHL